MWKYQWRKENNMEVSTEEGKQYGSINGGKKTMRKRV